MKKLMLAAIRFYQRAISPLHPLLPLYPHLFPVRPGGGGEIRHLEGGMAGPAAYPAVPSLPPAEVRPVRPRTLTVVRLPPF